MEYKGYEIKEEVLDWLVDMVTSNGRYLSSKECLANEVHEIRRIGNYIGFRQTITEAKQYTHK